MNLSQSRDAGELVTQTYSSIEILAPRPACPWRGVPADPRCHRRRGCGPHAGPRCRADPAGWQVEPRASTGPVPPRLDAIQDQAGDGPYIKAARAQALVRISDTRAEERGPQFTTAAREAGVRSVLCAPLQVDEQCPGTLALYAPEGSAFGEHDEADITLFAILAAIALAEAQRAEQLRTLLPAGTSSGRPRGS